MAVKHMILNEIPTTKILIIDVENEYNHLCKKLNGKVIECDGIDSGGVLNPLQVRINRDDEIGKNALSLHFQFLETFFQILYPSLTEIEFSKLDLIFEKLYTKFNITKETDISKLKNTDFPILEDLYFFIDNENKKHQDTVYEKLLALIRPICIGQASSIWNGYTNIEVDTRITTFNTSTMQKFQIQYKRAQYYNICKMARKHNSSICVISQSIEDYLNEKIRLYGQSLLANSTNKLFFKCDGKDLKDIVNIFNLTEQEEKMILNAKVGECLFMCGTRKLYMIFKLFDYELEMIDSKFAKSDVYE